MRRNFAITLLLCASTALADEACTHLDQGEANTDAGATFTTASLSSNTAAVRFVSVNMYDNSGVSSVSGDGLTYTLVDSEDGGDDAGLDTHILVGAGNPTSGALTVTLGATGVSYAYQVTECTGVNTAAPTVQDASARAGTGTTASVTLSAFADANNGAFAVVTTQSGNSITPGTGWTELHEFQGIFGTYGFATMWRTTADTSVDATLGGDTNWVIIGVELDEAGVAATGLLRRRRSN